MIRSLFGELGFGNTDPACLEVAAHEHTVERSNRQVRWERVEQRAATAEACRLQVARAERAPDVVQVPAQDDRSAALQMRERMRGQETLQLQTAFRTRQAEVHVDEQLGVIRVTRVVSAVAAGRILNTKTASSQILGSVVWGIGMALHEETLIDHGLGRIMNANIAEYHVPVNADIHDIRVIFVDEPDDSNPLGIKGLGEIGIVGVAAAIANAVYHATGKRVRDLPITLDKLRL